MQSATQRHWERLCRKDSVSTSAVAPISLSEPLRKFVSNSVVYACAPWGFVGMPSSPLSAHTQYFFFRTESRSAHACSSIPSSCAASVHVDPTSAPQIGSIPGLWHLGKQGLLSESRSAGCVFEGPAGVCHVPKRQEPLVIRVRVHI